MSNDVGAIIEESMNLELNVSDLYFRFHKLFQEDAQFWRELMLEEKNHAAIFLGGKEIFDHLKIFPNSLLNQNLQNLKDANKTLLSLITRFQNTPPSREEAFNTALKIENSAAELHFHKFMEEESDSGIKKIFKKLNQDDKEHALRIRTYMKNNGVSLQSENGQ